MHELEADVAAEHVRRILGRQGHERLVERRLDTPRGVLVASPARQREAAPGAAVQLHQPRPAVVVAQELEHEESTPPDPGQEALGGPGEALVDRMRLARGRGRPLRVQHPDAPVSAPRHDAVLRHVPEQPLARAPDQRLDDERRVPGLLADARELVLARHRAAGRPDESAVDLVERARGLHDDRVGDGRDVIRALDDLCLRDGQPRLACGFQLERLVQRELDLAPGRPCDRDLRAAEHPGEPHGSVVEREVCGGAGRLHEAVQVRGRRVDVVLGSRDSAQLDAAHAPQRRLRAAPRERDDAEPRLLQRPGRLDRRHRLREADDDGLAVHRHRFSVEPTVCLSATRPACARRSSEAGVSEPVTVCRDWSHASARAGPPSTV